MKPFTVKMGTVFESSHVPLHVWLQAVHLMVSSKKGVSSNQIHRTMGVTLKTAWFMSHRIREAMKEPGWPLGGKLGGQGETLEADDILGWSWLVAPYYWRFDARAMEVTRAIALDGKCLRSKCEENHDLGYNLLKRFVAIVEQRLQSTRMQLLDVYAVHR